MGLKLRKSFDNNLVSIKCRIVITQTKQNTVSFYYEPNSLRDFIELALCCKTRKSSSDQLVSNPSQVIGSSKWEENRMTAKSAS